MRILAPALQAALETAPFKEWLAGDGTLWAQFFRAENGYTLRFPGLADFRLSSHGRDATCEPTPGVSEETVRHLYLNQILPLALSRQGKLVLHASAVDLGGQAVAFLGESGRGKSTLAASLAMRGHSLLTDDGLTVDDAGGGIRALPSHPSLRLWDDSREALLAGRVRLAPPLTYTAKARLLAEGVFPFCAEPRPLGRAYVLGGGQAGGIVLLRMSSRDALIELVKHSFVLDAGERDVLTSQFDRLSRVAQRLPVFHLDFPRRFEMLDEVRRAILDGRSSVAGIEGGAAPQS